MAKMQNINDISPNFLETTNFIKDGVFYNLVCHNIGRIISFNAQNQTAEIELMQLKQYGEYTFTPTILSEIPVIIYGTSMAQITLPDLTGTICVILTFDRNIDAFMETGEAYSPGTTRAHNITDSVALPTFFPFNASLQDYDTQAITIKNKIKDEEENVTYAQIKVTNKLNLQNTQRNLATLIQSLLTACENIATVADESGGTLTPNAKQAFTDLKQQFGELLQ